MLLGMEVFSTEHWVAGLIGQFQKLKRDISGTIITQVDLALHNILYQILEHQKRDEEECRLFELTKNLPNKGVGRLVYNKYERNMQSANLDVLSEDGEVYPETYWVISTLPIRNNSCLVDNSGLERLDDARKGFTDRPNSHGKFWLRLWYSLS